MTAGNTELFRQIVAIALGVIPAITLHEVAHGWMALYFGDTTARDAKRLSLNPLRHVDPVGTLLVPGLLLLFHAPFFFGWAKPVPVDFRRVRNGSLGVLLVAMAGPLSNLIQLLCWRGVLAFMGGGAHIMAETQPSLMAEIAVAAIVSNLVLLTFNLIPIPPLDGGRMLGAVLPERLAKPYLTLQRYGMWILIALIVSGVFREFFTPLLGFLLSLLGLS